MKTSNRIHLLYWTIAALFAAGIGWAATIPTTLNSLLIPANLDEANFPATTVTTRGGILFGVDGGVPYWSPGDGGTWQTFGGAGGAGCGTGAAGPCVVGQGGFYTDGGITVAITGQPNEVVSFQNANGHNGTSLSFENGATDWYFQKLGAGTIQSLTFQYGGVPYYVWDTAGLYAVTGQISATNQISSTIVSGNNAFAVTQNGARVDYGAGATDYATSDGTTVSYAGPLASNSAAAANAFSVSNLSRIDLGSGSLDYVVSNGTNTVLPSVEFMLSSSYIDGLVWSGTNTRAVISSQQAYTVARFVWFGNEGTKVGTVPNIQWGIANAVDGGVCSGSFQCDLVCPDAGNYCSIPMTGQCDFAAGEVTFATFLGGSVCSVNPSSGAPHIIWGTLR